MMIVMFAEDSSMVAFVPFIDPKDDVSVMDSFCPTKNVEIGRYVLVSLKLKVFTNLVFVKDGSMVDFMSSFVRLGITDVE